MIEISNRHCEIILDKLPRILEMARNGEKPHTLSQSEDIRLLSLLHARLRKKYQKCLTPNNNHHD